MRDSQDIVVGHTIGP